ncbi:ABC transporter [Arthrobacter sp. MYb211]|uniref:ABC transporter n=1 Tax=unclassified Arthrobacter TaxID=235627 RepID=UPI000CFBD012|nr:MULTISPECIES: ABC transporter [unclassified Arthrobacter]PRA10495.1 ABC transporter [Arthrobacter sp. MYb221]PRC06065.1 ABC transporter [Arthrobacter sp. MYb211]
MSTLQIGESRTGDFAGPLLRATGAEATKFFGLRALVGLYASGILATIALGWLLGASAKASGDNGFDTAMPAPLLVFATLQFSQLFFAAVAALHITNEYSSGSIYTTLQSVPRRSVMLGAKALLLAGLGFLAGVAMIGLGTIPAALSAGQYGAFTFSDLVSACLGAGAYLALLSLMVLGLGLLCRNSAGAIVSAIMLVIGLPQILQLIPFEWVQTLAQYLPTNAATFMATGATEPYGPPAALLVLIGWTVVLLGAGYIALKRRDA